MFTLMYLTGDGWQWITYDGMMPVGRTREELVMKLNEYGWTGRGTHRIEWNGQSFQCRVVDLSRVLEMSPIQKYTAQVMREVKG